jgi:hypothetical protein
MDLSEARRTLEVKAGTDAAGLKAAYRRQAKRFHPDRFRTFTEKRWATRKFVRVREAYDVLHRAGSSPVHAGSPSDAAERSPFVGFDRVEPWVTPGETPFTIDVDPFVGYYTLARIFLLPFTFIDDSAVSRWLGDRGWDALLLPLMGLFALLAFPAMLGLVAVLLPVLLAHTLLLGAGALLDPVLGKDPERGSTVIVDAVASPGAWFLVETLVGGGVLGVILTAWYGRESLTGAEATIGVALWAAPALFLLSELTAFLGIRRRARF